MIIEINPLKPTPLYEQLRNQVILGRAAKELAPGETLPSVRRLAADLSINFHTVNKAYTMLCDEGYLTLDRRRGAALAPNVPKDERFLSRLSDQLTQAAAESLCRDMDEAEFITLCSHCYHHAQGHKKNGETHHA